jgi:stearoyl-CoA desaturase (Delta-9 desaturase)
MSMSDLGTQLAAAQRGIHAYFAERPFLNALFMFVLPVAGLIGAIVTLAMGRVTGTHLVLFAVGFVLTGWGITVGFHRMMTHRSFETYPVVKAILLILGSMAVEGPPRDWVAVHLMHHAESDQAKDPHTPLQGFFHAHWGWLMVILPRLEDKYTVVVERDPVARWVSDTFVLWVALGYIIPTVIAGWEGFIWGGLFRQFAVHHVTFAVNSICHVWGARPFETTDLSRNHPLVGLFGLGEGWHNNHHAFPSSAFHGLRWWEVDLSAYLISALKLTGLAWRVQRPTREQIERRRSARRPVADASVVG